MKQTLLILIFSVLLSSCATILNQKTYDVRVSSNVSNASVKIMDSLYKLPSQISVKRSNKDLQLTLIADSLNKDYKIKASNDPVFRYNLLCLWGYMVDLTNKKRFYYGESIFLNKNDTIQTLYSKDRNLTLKQSYIKNKGEIYLHLSLPYVNSFFLQPNGENAKGNTGFWGLSAGIDYYYTDNRFLNIGAAIVTAFFLPIPAAVDIFGEHESIRSNYIVAP